MKKFYLTCLCLAYSTLVYAATVKDQRDFYSQASQDAFVKCLLYDIEKKEDKGFYLEIGSAHPTLINNSYFFEKNYKWEGVSIDIAEEYRKPWSKTRKNLLLIQDATKTDYSAVLKSFPKVIDYLSLDVDGQYDTVLKLIPFDKHIFKIITIEHDSYRYGDLYRQKERKILTALGYHLLCPDVRHAPVGPFEDWWIHPSQFSDETFAELTSLDLEDKDQAEIVGIIKKRIVRR